MPQQEFIKEALEKLKKSHTEFCEKQDAKLAEIEKKGGASAETKAQAEKALAEVSKLQADFDTLQKNYARDRAVDNLRDGSVRSQTERFRKYIIGAEQKDVVAKEYKQLFFDDNNQYSQEKTDQYQKAFESYMLTGDRYPMNEHLKSMNVISDVAGGYLVSPVMGELITHTITEFSPFHQYVDNVVITADQIDYPTTNRSLGATRKMEVQSRGETTAPTFGEVTIKPDDLYAEPTVTQRMLDLRPDMESWLAVLIAEQFIITEANEIANGDGIGRCRGFLTFSHGTTVGTIQQTPGTDASALVGASADAIRDMDANIKPAYGANANYFGRRATFSLLAQLKDGQGRYIWQPGLAVSNPSTLLGRPVVFAEDMTAVAADALALALANLKSAYKFVTMPGVRVLRDPYTNKPFVNFNTTKRSAGNVVIHEAIKLLKIATTVS